jgi:hypothetical protein
LSRSFARASLLLLALLAACDRPSRETGPHRFLFSTDAGPAPDHVFVADTRDPELVTEARRELARDPADRRLRISGPIARGNGRNLAWGWHFRPGEWRLVTQPEPACDGTPRAVDEDPGHFVDELGRFCPATAYLVSEIYTE